MLDRRDLVTGLATFAVAGVVPALPASAEAAPDILRRSFRISEGEEIAYFGRRFSITIRFLLYSVWHYDEDPSGRIAITHGHTRITFVSDPMPRHARLTRWNPFPDDPAFQALTRAATLAADQAYFLRMCRRHPGAIFMGYLLTDPRDPFGVIDTADARPSHWKPTFKSRA